MSAQRRPSYYVRPARDRPGYVVASRGLGWNIAVLVHSREHAEVIRDAYRVSRERGEAATCAAFDCEVFRADRIG